MFDYHARGRSMKTIYQTIEIGHYDIFKFMKLTSPSAEKLCFLLRFY